VRKLRESYPGAWHHVINRGRSKQTVFREPDDYNLFLKLIKKGVEQTSVRVHAFCLMDNHFHLLVSNQMDDLSDFIKRLTSEYSQKFNMKYKLDGSLFKSRFFSKVVDVDEYLVQLISYIHKNPLSFLSESELASYPYSSYSHYLGKLEFSWLEKVELEIKHESKGIKSNLDPNFSELIYLSINERLRLIGFENRQSQKLIKSLLILSAVNDPESKDSIQSFLEIETMNAFYSRSSRSKKWLQTNFSNEEIKQMLDVISGCFR